MILDAVKDGINITNVNGTTNIIIAIGSNVSVEGSSVNFTTFGNGRVKVAKISDQKEKVSDEKSEEESLSFDIKNKDEKDVKKDMVVKEEKNINISNPPVVMPKAKLNDRLAMFEKKPIKEDNKL
jgi:hypothetical protein